jgi:hypothetical protein
VGIGVEEKRAFSKKDRNKYWKNIINKVGYSVNIIHKDIDWENACKIEKLLIEKYGRKDLGLGNLVNMTDGGEGVLGLIMSEETRQKLSEASKGNTNFLGKTHSEETRQKIGEGNKGKIKSEETRQKLSEANKGKTLSEETKQKIGEANKGNTNMLGKTHSEETKQKMSEANKGNTNMLGKTHSEETRQKMSEAKKGKTRSEETRQKISEAKKGEKNAMFGKTFSDEHKQKISLGKRNKEGVKGYSFHKPSKKYHAKIKVRGKQIHLGLFNTPEEAELAYKQGKLVYHI